MDEIYIRVYVCVLCVLKKLKKKKINKKLSRDCYIVD